MASNSENLTAQRLRKKRIPTACGACRASKVRCNGGNPCTRCRSLKKVCNFTERPKDPYQEKIDALSDQVSTLKRQLDTNTNPQEPNPASISTTSNPHNQYQAQHPNSTTSQYSITTPSSGPLPLLRTHFTGSPGGRLPDLISVGLLTASQATHYFTTFFAGCDHYVPVFDPAAHDTLASVRQRSGLLLAAICTVGCRVACGTDSHAWRLLNFHLGRMLGSVLSAPGRSSASLETVQALLVRACYSAERSLLVASATRLAIDMGLPRAYDELLARMAAAGDSAQGSDTAELMRRARTWLHVLVLSHILHVDAGDMLPFTFTGDPRRARILLDNNPHATVLDRFLFAQVELNVLRAHIFTTLSERAYQDDDDMLSVVRDAKIDIALWHNDWERILQQMEPPVPAWILVNLGVQRCWATTMALCRAVRTAGVDNVDLMTPAQRSVLAMARGSLRLHLQTILAEPRSYLHNLRYAMDFVWAKCAFCYLLLLKLCVLLPGEEEDGDGGLNEDLIACGAVLSSELSDASGAGITGIANSTARMYLQLLQTGTETFARALQGRQEQPGGQVGGSNQDADAGGYPKAADELDAFVPDQFVFEWDFPGLTLFSSSTTGIGWLDDILLGALNGGGDFYGFMAPAAEFGDDTAG